MGLKLTPTFSSGTAFRTKVMSDLLAMEIRKRQGNPLILKDHYSGGTYLRDAKTGRFFSVGPDKLSGTSDDIMLGK